MSEPKKPTLHPVFAYLLRSTFPQVANHEDAETPEPEPDQTAYDRWRDAVMEVPRDRVWEF